MLRELIRLRSLHGGIIQVHRVAITKTRQMKTHTARCSGATNMYLAGIPTIAIMKITGHKTEREFMKYIKITEEQTALELMSHPYFSGKQANE